jgi:hypothetical protein
MCFIPWCTGFYFTEQGYQVLTYAIPKTIADIEAIMQ